MSDSEGQDTAGAWWYGGVNVWWYGGVVWWYSVNEWCGMVWYGMVWYGSMVRVVWCVIMLWWWYGSMMWWYGVVLIYCYGVVIWRVRRHRLSSPRLRWYSRIASSPAYSPA
jgi:hypothetical protein